MAKITIHNLFLGPQEVSFLLPPAKPVVLQVGKSADLEDTTVDPGWLQAAEGCGWIRVTRADTPSPTPTPNIVDRRSPPQLDERALLVREARAMGIKVKKHWTTEQIVEAMTK